MPRLSRTSSFIRMVLIGVLAVMFPLGFASAIAATEPRIEILTQPSGEPVKEVPLVVPAGESGGSVVLYVRQRGAVALEDITFTAIGASGQVTITSIDGQPKVTIPASPEAIPVTVKVEGLKVRTDSKPVLFASGEKLPGMQVGTIHVIRDDAPALSVSEGTGTQLQFSQSSAALSRVVEIAAGVTPVVATLEQAYLQDISGSQVPLVVAVDGEPVPVDSTVSFETQQLRLLTMTATLPAVGKYSGRISLRYGDPVSRLSLAVSVDQTAGTQTVKVSPTQHPRNVDRPVIGSVPASTEVTLQEQGGERAVLGLQVVQVTRSKHDQLTTASVEPSVSIAELSLAPWQSSVVTVTLGALTEPGLYQATLRGSTGSSPPVDVVVEFRVRDSWLWAAGLIASGTLLAWVLRWWLGAARARAETRVSVDSIGQSIARLSRETESRLVAWPPDAQAAAHDFFRRLTRGHQTLSDEARSRKPPGHLGVMIETWEKRVRLAGAWAKMLTTVAGLNDADRSAALVMLQAAQGKLMADPLEEKDVRELLADAESHIDGRMTLDAAVPVDLPEPELSGAILRKLSFVSIEAFTFAVFLLIAVLSGMNIIYFASATWGGPQDWLLAFLWGMGVQQAGIATAEGIHGARARYTPAQT